MTYVIDGVSAIQAAYEFAGSVGISPRKYSLRELFRMSIGKQKLLRKHAFWQSIAIFGTEDLDIEAFLYYGRVHKMTSSGIASIPLDEDTKDDMAELQAFAEKKYQEEKAIDPNAVFKLPVTEWLQMKAQRKQESQGKES